MWWIITGEGIMIDKLGRADSGEIASSPSASSGFLAMTYLVILTK